MILPSEGNRLRKALAPFFNWRVMALASMLSAFHVYCGLFTELFVTCVGPSLFGTLLFLFFIGQFIPSMITVGLFWDYVHAQGWRNDHFGEWINPIIGALMFVSSFPGSIIYAGIIYRLKDSTKAQRFLWVALIAIQWLCFLLPLCSYYANELGFYLKWGRFTEWHAQEEYWTAASFVIGIVALYGIDKYRRWARLLHSIFAGWILALGLEDVFIDRVREGVHLFNLSDLSLLLILQLLTVGLSYTKAFKTRFQPPVQAKDMAAR